MPRPLSFGPTLRNFGPLATGSLAACSFGLLLLTGCGGGTPAPAPQAAPAAGTPAPGAPAAPAAAGTPAAAPASDGAAATAFPQSPPEPVDPKRKETRWLGKIPYDVFFDRPLTVATDQTVVSGAPAMAATTPMPMSPAASPTPMPAAPAPAAGGGSGAFDLTKLASIEALIEESKQSRTKLTTGLQKLGDFNRNFAEVSAEAAVLASVAKAVGDYPGADQPNWKAKAKFIRDEAKTISSQASDKGSERFKIAKESFDKICDMLDGGKPPAKDAADVVPYSDVTTLSDIMWKFQKTFDYLKLNITDEKRFKEDKASVEREAMVFNLLAGIMASEGYEYLDDDEYMAFHKRLIDGTMQSVEAVKSDDFQKFRMSLNGIDQAMAECHPKYRTGG